MIGFSPQDWHNQASAAAQTGDLVSALAALRSGLKAYPDAPALWHGAGSVLLSQGKPEEAAEHFGKAFALEPKQFDHAVDQAIALSGCNDHMAAQKVLKRVEKKGSKYAHYCSTRANTERGLGNLKTAAMWYDRALRIEPARPKALVGRANVALERGESSTLKRFDKALAIDPANPMIALGKAQALEMEGDLDRALELLETLTSSFPQLTDALRLRAQLRFARGDADFTSHYALAMERAPGAADIAFSWCLSLAGMDHEKEAAERAAEARIAFPENADFALLEAVYAGASGNQIRANRIFSKLNLDTPQRNLHEARHRIRMGEHDRAEELLNLALTQTPGDIEAWAMRGIVWRLTGDPRADWLHEQAGLVELLPLNARSGLVDKSAKVLRKLHEASTMQIGQALRGGTQTRGSLFQRADPVLAELNEAAGETLKEYRQGLPPYDANHPLLRQLDEPWRIAGSWSVRMTGNGSRHKTHIHPEGIVSSALYLAVPDDVADTGKQEGWLELGKPPIDLGLDLPPIRTIKPQPGHLALFPSTLFHGTKAVSQTNTAERLTVAFDVAAR